MPQFVNLGWRTNAAELDEVAGLLSDATNVVVGNSCTVTREADRDTRKAVAGAAGVAFGGAPANGLLRGRPPGGHAGGGPRRPQRLEAGAAARPIADRAAGRPPLALRGENRRRRCLGVNRIRLASEASILTSRTDDPKTRCP